VSERPKIPRGVQALLASKFFNAVAVVCQVTALGVLVFDMTGRTLDLGLLGLAEFAPTALLSPFTGAITDRFDRRYILGIGLAGELVASFVLLFYARSGPSSLPPVLLIVIFFGIARAFYAPPSRALPVDLAPPGTIERVLALNAATWQTGAIIGPIAAGFLYAVEPWTAFAFSSVLFTLSLLVVLRLPNSGVARLETSGVKAAVVDALEGLRFIRRTPVLFGAISLDLFAVLFGGAIALLPAIAKERLGVGAVGLGFLRASVGFGAVSMSLALAVRPLTRRVGPVLLAAVALFGVATVVLGFTRSYLVALFALLVAAASDSVSVFIRSTIVPLATPENMRGRVLATENVFIGASNELGAFESGVAGHFLGLVGGIVSGGLGTLAVVGVWWKAFPALRKIDRFEELRPAEPDAAVPSG
jgi:MFS family permease